MPVLSGLGAESIYSAEANAVLCLFCLLEKDDVEAVRVSSTRH